MKEALPRAFGRYRLLQLLGEGGMASVYRAETAPIAGISRAVAIKRILTGPRDPELEKLLVDEARIWVRLHHANIVSVVDFGHQDGDWFLALELVDGVSAAQLLARDGPLPVPEALCVIERVAKALAHAHALEDHGAPLGIVHRDVKPANILLSPRGEVKLTDFGIARAADRRTQTQAGQVRGSVPYMSPEQVRGETLDGRSDLFALGCTFHELVTGSVLVDLPREKALLAIAKGEIPPPPGTLAPAVRSLLQALTAPDRRKRPASAADVARQLRAMLLPEAPEDLESSLAARVKRDHVSPPKSPHFPADITTAPSPSAAEDTTAPVPPPPGRGAVDAAASATPPGRVITSDSPKFQRLGIAAFAILLLTAAVFGGRYSLCRLSLRRLPEAGTLTLSLSDTRDERILQCRACGSTPARRIAASLAAYRAGDPLPSARARLGPTPEERRVSVLLQVAEAGWSADAARSAAKLLGGTPDDQCLASTLLFDGGAIETVPVPVSAASEPCGLRLRGSGRLFAGELTAAQDLFERAGDVLGETAVASLRDDAFGFESTMVRLARAPRMTVEGLWLPASWAPGASRGRLTTVLDEPSTVLAILRGDELARRGQLALARNEYRKEAGRGVRLRDLENRLADLDRAETLIAASPRPFGISEPLAALTGREPAISAGTPRPRSSSTPAPVAHTGILPAFAATPPDPAIAKGILDAAERRMEDGKIELGLSDLAAAIRKSPGNEPLIAGAFRLAVRFNRKERAREFGEEYLRRFPKGKLAPQVHVYLQG